MGRNKKEVNYESPHTKKQKRKAEAIDADVSIGNSVANQQEEIEKQPKLKKQKSGKATNNQKKENHNKKMITRSQADKNNNAQEFGLAQMGIIPRTNLVLGEEAKDGATPTKSELKQNPRRRIIEATDRVLVRVDTSEYMVMKREMTNPKAVKMRTAVMGVKTQSKKMKSLHLKIPLTEMGKVCLIFHGLIH